MNDGQEQDMQVPSDVQGEQQRMLCDRLEARSERLTYLDGSLLRQSARARCWSSKFGSRILCTFTVWLYHECGSGWLRLALAVGI